MAPKVVWLFVFVLLYWGYCIFWGIRGARLARTASDYFIAGRKLSLWVFVLAATATSYSGWTFMGHPGLIYRDGFQYAYASFYAIAIPFTGVIFLKRQWMLGKRFGYVTPGEMMADYFQGDAIRVLTVTVALFYSIPYLGVQLGASGYMFNVLTTTDAFPNGMVGENFGMWMLSLVVLIYVASGGLRAVAYVDTVQCLLLWLGIVIVGVIALQAVGGWESLNQAMASLARTDVGRWGTTAGVSGAGGDFNAYFAVPGIIQWTAGVGDDSAPTGGIWTGMMILTYMFALMGIQAAPAFTMWSFSNSDPSPFAPQAVWASAAWIGGTLIFFTAIQGMAAQFLGANPWVNAAGLAVDPTLIPASVAFHPDALVPHYFNLIADHAPWLVGLLAVCALAAMQSTGAAYMSTAGGILTRDLYKRYLNPRATHVTQKLFGRLSVAFIVVCALLVATYSRDALVLLGGLAVAFGFQMWVPLAAICYLPWITRAGATWGLAVGLIAVALTDSIGQDLLGPLLPWRRWPLTIHSAGWGIVANIAVCVVISALTQDEKQRAHRLKFHAFLRNHTRLPAHKRRLVPLAWVMTIAWLIFAVGPGAVIGNWIFGDPGAGRDAWTFGIPSIWAWQILFWLLGIALLWFLAYRMEMASVPAKAVEALVDDIGDTPATRPIA
ncbi:MAG: sodium:solute symporter family protein [Rhodospirillales bacterium]|nr:sodium:solute symporter family protein [Rhodospirillales bacterium]